MSFRAPRHRQLSDEELMTAYVQGDEAAFEVLLKRFRQPLFGFLFRYLGRADRAEDVFQEVFFEVIRARKRYKPDFKFSAWIFRIARNRAVDRLRRDGFRDMESLDAGLDPRDENSDSRINNLAGEGPNPEEAAGGREFTLALEEIMAGLPPEQREVFWLKERSGLSLAEIADMTGAGQNTVKSRLRYALEKIRDELIERGFTP
ncbi:MAG: RNA polymerase sigma factor [Pseudomonadota bacterium]